MAVMSLPSQSNFDAVFSSPDAKSSTKDFLVLAKRNSHLCVHRVGFVTSKKKIRRAVDRNRFRRVFREYLRTGFIAPASDIIVIARKVPDSLRSSQFRDELHQALSKLSKRLEATDAS
ncbi:ribonuclease P protein component [Litorivicinus sp.]|nr:ribonuclease P protein component [Litorivicinus sp.]